MILVDIPTKESCYVRFSPCTWFWGEICDGDGDDGGTVPNGDASGTGPVIQKREMEALGVIRKSVLF